MTTSIVLPLGGVAGWRFLQRTLPRQMELQQAQPAQQRAEAHSREKISTVRSAEELVSDRQLREVALTAFGLGDDINNIYFIQKVLEEGTLPGSLASKLSDPRYSALSDAFGFGQLGNPNTFLPDFADEILEQYQSQRFETSVGEVDANMRLALGLQRELETVLERTSAHDARWFSLMGSTPLRTVFETALNLPDSTGRLDIDQQLEIFTEKAEQVFGTSDLAELAKTDRLEELRNQFLLKSSIGSAAPAVASPALSLLSGGAGVASILGAYYG